LPASIFIPLMLGQASALWKAPSPRSLAALAITAVVAVGVSVWLRRRLSGVTLVQGSQGD